MWRKLRKSGYMPCVFFDKKHTVIGIQRVAFGVNPAAGVMRCFCMKGDRHGNKKQCISDGRAGFPADGEIRSPLYHLTPRGRAVQYR